MINLLERVSDAYYHGFFVDLFVKTTNKLAITMYEGMGYSVWRRIKGYYGGKKGLPDEDAFGTFTMFGFCSASVTLTRSTRSIDMRKPLSRDPQRKSVRANGRDVIHGFENISM